MFFCKNIISRIALEGKLQVLPKRARFQNSLNEYIGTEIARINDMKCRQNN